MINKNDIITLYRENKNYTQIAKILGCSKQYVYKVIKKYVCQPNVNQSSTSCQPKTVNFDLDAEYHILYVFAKEIREQYKQILENIKSIDNKELINNLLIQYHNEIEKLFLKLQTFLENIINFNKIIIQQLNLQQQNIEQLMSTIRQPVVNQSSTSCQPSNNIDAERIFTSCQPVVNQNCQPTVNQNCQPVVNQEILQQTDETEKNIIRKEKNQLEEKNAFIINNNIILNNIINNNKNIFNNINNSQKMILLTFYEHYPPNESILNFKIPDKDLNSALKIYARGIEAGLNYKRIENEIKNYIRRAKVQQKNLTLQDIERWFFGRTAKLIIKKQPENDIIKNKIEEFLEKKKWKI